MFEAEWYTSSEQLNTLSISSSAKLPGLMACARPWRNALISVRIKWNKLRAGYVCDITKHSRALKSLGRAAGPRATSLTNIKLEMSSAGCRSNANRLDIEIPLPADRPGHTHIRILKRILCNHGWHGDGEMFPPMSLAHTMHPTDISHPPPARHRVLLLCPSDLFSLSHIFIPARINKTHVFIFAYPLQISMKYCRISSQQIYKRICNEDLVSFMIKFVQQQKDEPLIKPTFVVKSSE